MLTPEEVRKLELETKAEPQAVVEDKPAISIASPELDEMFVKARVAEILGTPAIDSNKYDFELSRIVDWARSKGAKTNEDMFWEIRSLKDRLSSPSFGENGIKYLYQYVYLLNEQRDIKDKIIQMEADGR